MELIPPPIPTTSVYTKCYCEENVYLLIQSFFKDPSVSELWDIFAVFISNETRSVALRNQKAAREPNNLVIWDYHVVLLLRQKGLQPRQLDPKDFFAETGSESPRAWVYDFDTTIVRAPCPLRDYLHDTFFPFAFKPYTSLFRLIRAEEFLTNFASDRTHMLKAIVAISAELPGEDALPPEYHAPPPLYPAICGAAAAEKGVKSNLMSSFVSMTEGEETFGKVLDLQTLYTLY